ncbi:MAG: trypsin-like peptidase domain-containing protein [Bacillota bacterium]
MNHFFDGFSPKPSVRRVNFWKGIILGALVGGLLVTTLFFYLAGNVLPQEQNGNGRAVPLPGLEQNRAGQILEITPEVKGYYMAVVKAAEEVSPSVVGISNFGVVMDFWGRSSLQERATGSGVIIDETGYIVTNYHVIENARELIVILSDGEELRAKVVGTDPPTDLAVLKIEKEGLPAAMLADSDLLRVGEPAIAIGNPLGLDFQQSVTLGVVSARERSITIQGQKFTFIQTDAAINDGNSGGALVNIFGQVIGINTAKIKIPGVEGMGFAIPANTVKEITRDLITQGRVERPWLGVYLSTLTPMDAQRFALHVQEGVLIRDVISGGPADKVGIIPLDVVIAIDGKKITDSGQLQELLYKAKVGQKMDITLIRGREELTLTVTLSKLPERME